MFRSDAMRGAVVWWCGGAGGAAWYNTNTANKRTADQKKKHTRGILLFSQSNPCECSLKSRNSKLGSLGCGWICCPTVLSAVLPSHQWSQ